MNSLNANMSHFQMPNDIHFVTKEDFTSAIVKVCKGRKVLLLMNKRYKELFRLENLLERLNKETIFSWVFGLTPNPQQEDIITAFEAIGEQKPECIIAIGGGSVIDMAKAISALWHLRSTSSLSLESIEDSIVTKAYNQYPSEIDIYAVPTTSGTGSEVTTWATIWNKNKKIKLSIEALWLKPKTIYIIPEFTMFAPVLLRTYSGLDALCHAVEAYWAKATNPLTQELSKAAISLIIEYLPKSIINPQDFVNVEKMCTASVMAGIAFSNTRTTACHSIGYPLTIRFNIPHGLASAVTLADIMELNKESIGDYRGLLQCMRVKNANGLQLWIKNLCESINCPFQLSDYGVTLEDIPIIVAEAFTTGRIDNNPVKLTIADVVAILEKKLE